MRRTLVAPVPLSVNRRNTSARTLLVALTSVALGLLGGVAVCVQLVLWREEAGREYVTAEEWAG